MNGSDLLTVRDLTTGFGAVTVLHDLSFEVPRGQLTAILGLNGAGKSVTMKCVAGLVPVWSGDIRFAGRDVGGLSPEERVAAGMGHVTQGRQVFPELTVEENLRIGAYVLRQRDRSRYRSVLDRMYDRFPKLAQRRDQPAGTMSGGEQAMLAVARALMNEPELLLVDEPSAGLAPSIVAELMELLRGVADSGVTILMVEQNISFALDVADRALIMQRGHIVHGGAVADIDRGELARLLGIGRLLSRAVQQRTDHVGEPSSNGHGGASVVISHKGGGWYELPDGSTVRGKQAAQAAADELGAVVR